MRRLIDRIAAGKALPPTRGYLAACPRCGPRCGLVVVHSLRHRLPLSMHYESKLCRVTSEKRRAAVREARA